MNDDIIDNDHELCGKVIYVYLDIDNPIVAWSASRGILLSARYIANKVDDQALPISLMMASLLQTEGNPRYVNEQIIEHARILYGPSDCSSRLWGMFCFSDLSSARRAADLWKSHFTTENLVSGVVSGAGLNYRFDSNWITYAPLNEDDHFLDRNNLSWLQKYWSGEPYPDDNPIWEVIIDGKFTILGTRLRQKAYEYAAEIFPHSKALLELGRIAAWQGYDLGNISPFLFNQSDTWSCRYFMDMLDADNEEFLNSLVEHIKKGEVINYNYLKDFLKGDKSGCLIAPDLRPWSFWRAKGSK